MIRYKDLTDSQKLAVQWRLAVRRSIYEKVLRKEKVSTKILLVGDRPGPAAPTDPTYHHTPFHSIKHCSGWLNALLEVENIPEDKLVWLNAADRLGTPTDPIVLSHIKRSYVIALGGNAEKWLKNNGIRVFFKEAHPQYWKRFEHHKPYPLIKCIHRCLTYRPLHSL